MKSFIVTEIKFTLTKHQNTN